MTLSEFLLTRIAEEEATARAAHDEIRGNWSMGVGVDWNKPNWTTNFVMTHHPGRVLSECDSRRRIVETITHTLQWAGDESLMESRGQRMQDVNRMTLRLLALPYADHPDYDLSWSV